MSLSEIKEALSTNELTTQLRHLGVEEGMVLEVHCSLSSIGYVIGGAQGLVDALLAAVGHEGTLVMPLQSSDNTEPSYWIDPPADRALWEKIRTNTPAYHPDRTDLRGMSRVYQSLNSRGGSYASYHPSCGFVAYGKYAKLITNTQGLDFPLGNNSPLGKMYDLPSYVLLIGVGYDKCTGMHLGECRSGYRPVILQGGAVEEKGYRYWKKYLDYDLDSDDFAEIGLLMEGREMIKKGLLGESPVKMMKFQDVVDFTESYFRNGKSVVDE